MTVKTFLAPVLKITQIYNSKIYNSHNLKLNLIFFPLKKNYFKMHRQMQPAIQPTNLAFPAARKID